jgi:hypothetical protein
MVVVSSQEPSIRAVCNEQTILVLHFALILSMTLLAVVSQLLVFQADTPKMALWHGGC